jgi:hypothetical protein
MSRPVLSLAELSTRLQPVTRVDEQVLAVRSELISLFPWGGLRRGSILDIGSVSLCWWVIAEAVREGSWAAVMGLRDVGWASLTEHGVVPERVVAIDTPPADVAVTVLAALVDALDVVVVGPEVALRASDLRRLSARVRERGGVLIGVNPGQSAGRLGWAEGVDLRIHMRSSRWIGAGHGDGGLHGREVEIEAQGKGAAARARRVTLCSQGNTDGRWGELADHTIAEIVSEQTLSVQSIESTGQVHLEQRVAG